MHTCSWQEHSKLYCPVTLKWLVNWDAPSKHCMPEHLCFANSLDCTFLLPSLYTSSSFQFYSTYDAISQSFLFSLLYALSCMLRDRNSCKSGTDRTQLMPTIDLLPWQMLHSITAQSHHVFFAHWVFSLVFFGTSHFHAFSTSLSFLGEA